MLEIEMEAVMHRPVVFDLRMYKLNEDAANRAVVRGEVDFQKLSALTYVLAKESQPGLQALALEKRDREAVIFARKELGITDLSQVAGFRAVFAHTNSVISFLAKAHLARKRIFATNLKEYRNLERRFGLPDWVRQPNAPDHSGDDADLDANAHIDVLRQVLANASDVGVCPRLLFEMNKHRGQGLVELHSYPIPYDVHVAKPGLDAAVAEAFRRSIRSMRGRQSKVVLAGLARIAVIGYEPATEADFAELRSMQTNEIARFERGVSPQRNSDQ
jgi:hypothetical protein